MHRRAGGQALSEFIVIALALVSLFLLMPMIAKYQDLSHASEMVSRYVAFEANQNLFWVDAQGDALIKHFNDVTVSFGAAHGANHADGKSAGDDGKPFKIGWFKSWF